MFILYMTFICIYHPSLWTFTCFGGAPCLIVYAPESHALSNYRVRLVSGKKKKKNLIFYVLLVAVLATFFYFMVWWWRIQIDITVFHGLMVAVI
jgi:hypothetical protein